MCVIKVAAAVIEDDRGRVLVARHGPGGRLAGRWEFPGGKLEPGEEAPEALRREIREELGLEIRVGEFLLSFPHVRPGFNLELLVFRAARCGGSLCLTEHDAVRWAAAGELAALDLAEPDRIVAARFSTGGPAAGGRGEGEA